jgi:hypothetical protein
MPTVNAMNSAINAPLYQCFMMLSEDINAAPGCHLSALDRLMGRVVSIS